jgi:Mn-dependent DtxR family transcriptional regulator
MGKPDDGSQIHVIPDPMSEIKELIKMGLVHCTGKNQYDLTDDGEIAYAQLTGRRLA